MKNSTLTKLIFTICILSTTNLFGQLVNVHTYESEEGALSIKAHKVHGDLYIQTWNEDGIEQYITIPAPEVESNFQTMRKFMLDCITWQSEGAFYEGDVYSGSGIFYDNGQQILDINLDWSLKFLSTKVKGEYIVNISHDPMNGKGKTSPRGKITFKYSPYGEFKDFVMATSPTQIKLAQLEGK